MKLCTGPSPATFRGDQKRLFPASHLGLRPGTERVMEPLGASIQCGGLGRGGVGPSPSAP